MGLRKEGLFGLGLMALGLSVVFGAEGRTISLPAQGEVARAEIRVWEPEEKAASGGRAALVLCPGQNGSSLSWVEEAVWRRFAEREGLALVGMRFVSSDEDLKARRGYFVVSRGSGELLEEGLERAGLGGAPLLLYGFSGGAHFAMSFAAWRPERVRAFCAYSFAWWGAPPEELRCPALIVCGQADGLRYGSSFAYFQAGRRSGKPWAWMSLRDTPHAPNRELDEFVRAYFSSVLRRPEANDGSNGEASEGFSSFSSVQNLSETRNVTVDNLTKKAVTAEGREDDVSLSVLPGGDVVSQWREVHFP